MTGVREKADKISEDINQAQEQINKAYTEKDTERDVFWKAKYEFEIQRDFIFNVQKQKERKDELLDFQAGKDEHANQIA